MVPLCGRRRRWMRLPRVHAWLDGGMCRSTPGQPRQMPCMHLHATHLRRPLAHAVAYAALIVHHYNVCMQHDGHVPVKQRACATMGRPNGCNADQPEAFLRAHIKEPTLPHRACSDDAPPAVGAGVVVHPWGWTTSDLGRGYAGLSHATRGGGWVPFGAENDGRTPACIQCAPAVQPAHRAHPRSR